MNKNKKGFSISIEKIVKLILLAIVIIVVIGYSSNLNKEAVSSIESIFSPVLEARCNQGFYVPPINCDLEANLCSENEHTLWDEIKEKYSNYDCPEEGCSCIETKLMQELEKTPLSLTDIKISFSFISLENRFRIIRDDIKEVIVTFNIGSSSSVFTYSDSKWQKTDETNAIWTTPEFISKIQESKTLHEGLAHFLEEFEKDSQGSMLNVLIRPEVLFEEINLIYGRSANIFTYIYDDANSITFSQIPTSSKSFSLSSTGERYLEYELDSFSCSSFKLKKGQEILEVENFDIMCDSSTFGIEEFAQENNIDVNRVLAILNVESNKKYFYQDGHPIVRFECTRYNGKVVRNQQVPCDTSSFKYGSAADTGYEAFKRALAKNEEQALLQTSFGVGQVMGFNYAMLGFDSVYELNQSMFTEDGQISAFLKYLVIADERLLEELQSEKIDWRIVAEIYNGEDYMINNYHVKLEDAYNSLIS